MSSNNCNNSNNNINLEVTPYIAFRIFHCVKECFFTLCLKVKRPSVAFKEFGRLLQVFDAI